MTDEPMVKKTIRLYAGDVEELNQYYPTLGHNKVIRTLVRKHLRRCAEAFSKRSPQNEPGDFDITIEPGDGASDGGNPEEHF